MSRHGGAGVGGVAGLSVFVLPSGFDGSIEQTRSKWSIS